MAALRRQVFPCKMHEVIWGIEVRDPRILNFGNKCKRQALRPGCFISGLELQFPIL